MAVVRAHSLHEVLLGTVVIGGINRLSLATGTTVRRDSTDGDPWPRAQFIAAQQPRASFETRSLKAVIDEISDLGQRITLLTGLGPVALFVQKHKFGGTRETGTNHRKYEFEEGMVFPQNLTAQGRGDAVINCGLVSVYDGTTQPLVITDSVSLPSAVGFDQRWALGPCTVGGVLLPQPRSLEVNFGLGVIPEAEESEIFDTFVSVRTVEPEIILRGIDLEWLKAANIPIGGQLATHANTKIFLRKRTVGGQFELDATTVHIKITGAGLAVVENAVDASGADLGEATIRFTLEYDGTNNPLAFDTAIAIS